MKILNLNIIQMLVRLRWGNELHVFPLYDKSDLICTVFESMFFRVCMIYSGENTIKFPRSNILHV